MSAVGEERVIGDGESLCSSEGIALDAWNLHQPLHGVTGQAEVVFQSHLGVLDFYGYGWSSESGNYYPVGEMGDHAAAKENLLGR